jgi:hypothetical protein
VGSLAAELGVLGDALEARLGHLAVAPSASWTQPASETNVIC